MSKYIFRGEPRQFGRHGHLEKGDVVEFDAGEEAYQKENPHKEFKKLTPEEAVKAEKAMQDRAAAAAPKPAGQPAGEEASGASAPATPPPINLEDLSAPELVQLAASKGINVKRNASREDLIAAIQEAG